MSRDSTTFVTGRNDKSTPATGLMRSHEGELMGSDISAAKLPKSGQRHSEAAGMDADGETVVVAQHIDRDNLPEAVTGG